MLLRGYEGAFNARALRTSWPAVGIPERKLNIYIFFCCLPISRLLLARLCVCVFNFVTTCLHILLFQSTLPILCYYYYIVAQSISRSHIYNKCENESLVLSVDQTIFDFPVCCCIIHTHTHFIFTMFYRKKIQLYTHTQYYYCGQNIYLQSVLFARQTFNE